MFDLDDLRFRSVRTSETQPDPDFESRLSALLKTSYGAQA